MYPSFMGPCALRNFGGVTMNKSPESHKHEAFRNLFDAGNLQRRAGEVEGGRIRCGRVFRQGSPRKKK
ncbi:hypothetical protein RHMOL_Rhmol02G0009200 [Rhododendron molle]|uniref:Uncharacterized protein n=1 Tax=Rhododendron molle TaxID=49168 RepID=A0ACC0PKJ5_RHOML|nr:hypothetical protein RHMOL_Rhmol02G0009200 [Rhododendron molle]